MATRESIQDGVLTKLAVTQLVVNFNPTSIEISHVDNTYQVDADGKVIQPLETNLNPGNVSVSGKEAVDLFTTAIKTVDGVDTTLSLFLAELLSNHIA